MLVSDLQYLPKAQQFEIYFKRAIEYYAYINDFQLFLRDHYK
jgi:hypothetical protein